MSADRKWWEPESVELPIPVDVRWCHECHRRASLLELKLDVKSYTWVCRDRDECEAAKDRGHVHEHKCDVCGETWKCKCDCFANIMGKCKSCAAKEVER